MLTWIYIYKRRREFTSIVAYFMSEHAVRQIWLKYLWIRRQGHSPLSGVARRLLQQNLPSWRALCATASCAEVHRRSFSHRDIVISSGRSTGNAIGNCPLEGQCQLLDQPPPRPPARGGRVSLNPSQHDSLALLLTYPYLFTYYFHCLSTHANYHYWNAIWNLFLVTSRISMSSELHALSSFMRPYS